MDGKINTNKKDARIGEAMGDERKNETKVIDFESFSRTVELLNDLNKEHNVKIGFPTNGIYIYAKKDIVLKHMEKYNLEPDFHNFNKVITEILRISNVILRGEKKLFLTETSKKDNYIEKKIDLVQSKLINKDIREKYLLNKIYKTNILEEFDWEIVKKYYDKNESEVKDFPISVLRFRIRHTLDDYANREEFETFIFECTEYGIDELIRELNKIKTEFQKLKITKGRL